MALGVIETGLRHPSAFHQGWPNPAAPTLPLPTLKSTSHFAFACHSSPKQFAIRQANEEIVFGDGYTSDESSCAGDKEQKIHSVVGERHFKRVYTLTVTTLRKHKAAVLSDIDATGDKSALGNTFSAKELIFSIRIIRLPYPRL